MNILSLRHAQSDPETMASLTSSQLQSQVDRRGQRRVLRTKWRSSVERTAKNRKTINAYLRRMGSLVGKQLSLNSDGLCYFQYGKFIICIEVPQDQGVFLIYTMVCRVGPNDNKKSIMKAAMGLNYMQIGTRGACLGMEGDEVNLCFSAPMCGIARDDFVDCLSDFMHTAVEMNETLDSVK